MFFLGGGGGGGGVENWCYFRLRKSFFKCTFSRGKAWSRLLPGGCNVTIQTGMLVQFFGFEIWANPVVFWGEGGGVSKTGANVLGYVKLRPQKHVFTRDCNVICRSYCVAIAIKICDTATPIHGAMAKFADR